MNKKLIAVIFIYTAVYLPFTIGIDFLFSLMVYFFLFFVIGVFVSISRALQKRFKKKIAYFYPFLAFLGLDVIFLIYGSIINPDEFGLGLFFALITFAATVACVPFYFVFSPKISENNN